MSDSSSIPDGGRRRLPGTIRRRGAAVALGTVVVLVRCRRALRRHVVLVVAGALGAVVGVGVAAAVVLPSSGAPGGGTSDSDFLYGVSCASPRFCVAVGYYRVGKEGARSLVESWNGSRWLITPSADAGTIDELQGVSCVSPRFCVAVGSYRADQGAAKGRARSLVESWNGSRWSITPSPDTSDYNGDILASVSCTSGSFCAAAGGSTSTRTHRSQALAESWDGSRWSITPSARTPVGASDDLKSVSCTSDSACTAVGDYASPAPRPLAELWNGAQWSIAATPGIPPGGSAFTSNVSCTGSNSCIATGYQQRRKQSAIEPLAESWDGARWSIDTTPRADTPARFYGVSCAGTSDCMVTGWSRAATKTGHTLVASWDGAKWSATAGPAASGNNGLVSASCVPGFCAAAGYSSSAASARTLVERTLIEMWNGTRWSIAATPDA